MHIHCLPVGCYISGRFHALSPMILTKIKGGLLSCSIFKSAHLAYLLAYVNANNNVVVNYIYLLGYGDLLYICTNKVRRIA